MARRASVANTVVSHAKGRAGATPPLRVAGPSADYFIEKDGLAFAGLHVLLDFWGCRRLGELDAIEAALRAAVTAAGATLLEISLHRFTSSGGISGAAVLAEIGKRIAMGARRGRPADR